MSEHERVDNSSRCCGECGMFYVDQDGDTHCFWSTRRGRADYTMSPEQSRRISGHCGPRGIHFEERKEATA